MTMSILKTTALTAGLAIVAGAASAATTYDISTCQADDKQGDTYEYTMATQPGTNEVYYCGTGNESNINDTPDTLAFQTKLTADFGADNFIAKYDVDKPDEDSEGDSSYFDLLADFVDKKFDVDFGQNVRVVLTLKAGGSFAAFELVGQFFEGYWSVEPTKGAGISHITLYGGDMPQVPVPAGGLLLLSALAGAGVVARRRKSA